MSANSIYSTQTESQNQGQLQVRCVTNNYRPIENATVRISSTTEETIEELRTNISGLTETVTLPAPPIDYSLTPGSLSQPYSQFNITVTAPDYAPVAINAVEILPDVTAIQEIVLTSNNNLYVIPPHTLFGDYPPKIAETEIKSQSESGEIVLSAVVIPEYVIVHDGPPTDASAQNYYVKFKDYIKNVACSEIYATWPESTIIANILAILSFTLNRVYTEWYRNKGYNFTITSSTAFDHKWMPGRNFYDNISVLVDQLFVNYLSRPNVRQPILTQYCDGYNVQCPRWMTQWGSKDLGMQGLSAIQILRHFYGDSIYINTATAVSGVPVSWNGQVLQVGSRSSSVKTIQEQLNKISEAYPLIPKLSVDGIYGPKTENSVKIFQQIFNLPQTGIVDQKTWYKISGIFVAVSRLAEL